MASKGSEMGGSGSLRERLDDLRDDTANEQVELLLGIITDLVAKNEELEAEVSDLRSQVKQQDEKIARLQRAATSAEGSDFQDPTFDHRDRLVLDAIRESSRTKFKTQDLRQFYESEAGIRRDNTMRSRVKHLTTQGPFEQVAVNRWRFTE